MIHVRFVRNDSFAFSNKSILLHLAVTQFPVDSNELVGGRAFQVERNKEAVCAFEFTAPLL